MRRPGLIAAALLGAVVVAGCGAQGVVSPTPQTTIGTLTIATTTFPKVPAFDKKGDPQKGSSIFTSQGCGNCHTLQAAGSTGTIGPDLDSLKPNYQAATAQVTNGGGVMQAFKGTLSTQQIADVAAYVVKSTGGKVP